jgi:hypothetical protein
MRSFVQAQLIFGARAGAAIGIPSRMTQVLVPFHRAALFLLAEF